ncbi:hypothetical protein ACS0TY_013966 [Phlomoides rotata]
MMKKLNLCEQWRKWIHECISSASATVLVNGSPSGEFKLQRGLRQGDPLSHFLFLIVVEGLNILTKKAVELNLFSPILTDAQRIEVSILQYADDTIFTCTGDAHNFQIMKGLLRLFEFMSGLKVNFHKSNIYGYFLNPSQISASENALECSVKALPILYLGMKIGGNHYREVFWEELIQKVKR